MQAELSPTRNGTPVLTKTKATKSKATKKNSRKSKFVLSPRRRMAIGVGCVGVAVLALSVVHCTEAIKALTNSGVILSVLLAIGIDAGMVMCELATIISAHDSKPGCRRWATCYIVLSVLLSCLLNGWASGHGVDGEMQVAAYVVGGLVPVLVFVLGQVAGLLWEE
jgi:uncharacterized membrane protein